jgi:transcriptional regulator with XRE-family HTH domain
MIQDAKYSENRNLTAVELANVVKSLRKTKGYTQEVLAELATISCRSVQRLENGKGSSFETRRAIASGFDLDDIDCFNKAYNLPDLEKLKNREEEIQVNHVTLPVQRLNSAKLLYELIEYSQMDITDSTSINNKDAEMTFAKLIDYFRELREIKQEMSEVYKISTYPEIQEYIDNLSSLSFSLVCAKRELPIRWGESEKTVTQHAVYIICCPSDCVPENIAVPKNQSFQL